MVPKGHNTTRIIQIRVDCVATWGMVAPGQAAARGHVWPKCSQGLCKYPLLLVPLKAMQKHEATRGQGDI